MIDIEKILETYSGDRLWSLRHKLETDYFYHAKFFLALREKQPFIVGRHHAIIAQTLARVINGEIKRLIINIPPSYTKTELAVIQLCSYGFAINPSCKFLHISGSDTLALDNSSKIKDQITNPLFYKLWGVTLKDDAKAKGLWKTNYGGMFYAVSGGGQVIGFRAGRSKPGFQGCIIIDDPQKPEDMLSPVKINYFPDRYKSTFRHRVDNRETPIIVIMQRIHDGDFCNFLLEGGSGEQWHHLCLPSPIV